jgi:serine/threonine-protein kinase
VTDILSVQQDIAEKTVEALRSELEPSGARPAGPKKITANPEAFLLYLKGRYHLTRQTESEVVKAADLFDQATRVDPNFASAFAMCAQCHMFLGFYGFIPPTEGFERARPLLKRAIELDDDLDLAHMLMGRLLMDKDWDWASAEGEFRHAIALTPNSAEAHYRYALLLNDLSRNAEALAEVRAAEELDPLSVAVNQITGTVLYFAGRNRESIERFERAIEIDSNAALAHNNLGLALCREGRVDEGLKEIKRAIELDPKNTMFRTDLCFAYAKAGRPDEAREVLSQVEALTPGSGPERVPPIALAGMHASLGEVDSAIEWLQKAFEEHSPYLCSLTIESWFEDMRTDPRFVDMAHRVGLA